MLPDPQFLCIFTYKCAFRHSSVQFFDIRTSKSVPRPSIFSNILTSKCALKCSQTLSFCAFSLTNVLFCHSGVQFFDIRTSKSAPRPSVFVHFHLQMCFSPQQRAIFRHQNLKNCSDTISFFLHFHFQMCFSPQRRPIFDFSSEHPPPHPPL